MQIVDSHCFGSALSARLLLQRSLVHFLELGLTHLIVLVFAGLALKNLAENGLSLVLFLVIKAKHAVYGP